MERSDKTARELYQEIKTNPTRKRFGFGHKPALVNIDLQNSYTAVGEFSTAYETDPRQLDHVNTLADLFPRRALPGRVGPTSPIWIPAKIAASGAPVPATRPDSLQNIKVGSRRSEFDSRLRIDHKRDVVVNKRMASAFFETNLGSLFTFHRIDTIVVTGGSTSGCVRATVVDSLSHGYRTIVPEECVADKHESPHFSNLYDIALKYADVLPVAEVIDFMRAFHPVNAQ